MHRHTRDLVCLIRLPYSERARPHPTVDASRVSEAAESTACRSDEPLVLALQVCAARSEAAGEGKATMDEQVHALTD